MKQTIYILWVVFLIGCTSRTIYKKPKDLISKDQMVELWTEIHIANSASNSKNKKLQIKVNYLPFVYERYKIDSVRFMRSNIYYTSRVEDYEKMFKKVEDNLRKLRDTYDPEMAGIDLSLPVYVRDSLKKARREQKNKEKARELNLQQKLEEKNEKIRE